MAKSFFNHRWERLTRIKQQGCAWASQAARDFETPSLILLRKMPCFGLPIRVYLSNPWFKKFIVFHMRALRFQRDKVVAGGG